MITLIRAAPGVDLASHIVHLCPLSVKGGAKTRNNRHFTLKIPRSVSEQFHRPTVQEHPRITRVVGGAFQQEGGACLQDSQKLMTSTMCVWKLPTEIYKPSTKPDRGGVTILTNHGHQNGHFVPFQVDCRWTTPPSSRISRFGADNSYIDNMGTNNVL